MNMPMERQAARLIRTTVVLLVGNMGQTLGWYRELGFESKYYPPGFAIVWRDGIKLFLQHEPGYKKPDDPAARERGAWDVYIETDEVEALFRELSTNPQIRITRELCPQEYGQTEFDVEDVNGYMLVFAGATAKPSA
ncbi:Glyoxalase/bleomycin resistance protein/dioxygenase [Candidatus Koribacter versatilis Ellin345]|uniref:Glyoxalase/bleomycin resistance protein/dioxygenase n=2 Tax=Candidatus Korobacter versatilis TaxID=658062 RepID=Q1ISH9_KORVE|nr:Glyoxalase/bleomycin resistance protein/dioxygenase [Candidatus Koribacter versatilis Ellin345]